MSLSTARRFCMTANTRGQLPAELSTGRGVNDSVLAVVAEAAARRTARRGAAFRPLSVAAPRYHHAPTELRSVEHMILH